MEATFSALPSVKFERRAEKQKLPAFLQAYIKNLYNALHVVRDRSGEENVRTRVDETRSKPATTAKIG